MKILAAITVLLAALSAAPAPAPPVLRIPGQPDRPIAPESLQGRDSRDARLEDAEGGVTIYHGLPLLDVLERNGVEIRTMAGERRYAAAVVLASARDGYTVAFSVGELAAGRSNPRIFLVSETSTGPLPEGEGPVRLIVYGDPVRSTYALARIEVKILAENARK
jgi:hypothetical protein